MRYSACVLCTGFHSTSNSTSRVALTRLMPTDPARVEMRKTWHRGIERVEGRDEGGKGCVVLTQSVDAHCACCGGGEESLCRGQGGERTEEQVVRVNCADHVDAHCPACIGISVTCTR